MTYKLNPELRKITSPVVLIFPEGERIEYESGAAVAEATFTKKYLISSIKATENKIKLTLVEAKPLDGNASFF